MSGRPRSSGAGFTLIELLAVIAVIALLVSILIPSLQSARELSRRTVCMTNLRHMSMGANQYANDNAGCLPYRYGIMTPPKYDGVGNLIHAWSDTTVRGHIRWWYWADFIVKYIDDTAMPTRKSYPNCNYASVMFQPANDNYFRDYPWIIYSRLFNCPTQRNRDAWCYSEYEYNACTNWNSGDLWTNPPGYESDAAPVRPSNPPPKVTYFSPDQYCQFLEPTYVYPPWYPFPYRAADCVGYASVAPHLNNTTCGGFLDGHADVFTRDFLLGYAQSAQQHSGYGGYPFAPP